MRYNKIVMIIKGVSAIGRRHAHSFVDEYYWDTLDNAAKLVPAVSDTRGSNVFRVSAVLFEEIDPELLQKALERALEVFPAFAVRLRRGLFWYYLDANRETPRVTKESDYPCAPIGKGRDKGFLFRVTYYGKRINLEMFHALSDGMGAAQFLHVIVCYYFNLRDGEVMPEEYIRDYCDRVARDFDEDSFGRLAESNPTQPEKIAQPGKAEKEPDAFQFGGYCYDGARLGVLTLLLPADKLLGFAHELGCTMSEYLASLIIWAIWNTAYRRSNRSRPIVISLPVNLRGMFGSTTMRNFFGHVNISVKPSPGDKLEDIAAAVKESFASCLNREYFERQIAGNVAIEKITPVRFVPIWIKDLVMRIIFSRSEKNYTITMSNLGRLSLPDAIADRAERFEMLLGGSRTHPKKVSLCSYGNTLAISFSSTIDDNSMERFIAKYFSERGVSATVVSNETPPPEKKKKPKKSKKPKKEGSECAAAKAAE